jgi:hypothetical protein
MKEKRKSWMCSLEYRKHLLELGKPFRSKKKQIPFFNK